MSEHSIEELERQWQAADSKARQAAEAAKAAKTRLKDAKFDATGFRGCVAEYTRTTWKKTTTTRFLASGFSNWSNAHIEGKIVKKDGSLGERDVSCPASEAINLGPYVPPK